MVGIEEVVTVGENAEVAVAVECCCGVIATVSGRDDDDFDNSGGGGNGGDDMGLYGIEGMDE